MKWGTSLSGGKEPLPPPPPLPKPADQCDRDLAVNVPLALKGTLGIRCPLHLYQSAPALKPQGLRCGMITTTNKRSGLRGEGRGGGVGGGGELTTPFVPSPPPTPSPPTMSPPPPLPRLSECQQLASQNTNKPFDSEVGIIDSPHLPPHLAGRRSPRQNSAGTADAGIPAH